MIDAHCHLEQKDFEKDLNSVLKKCRDLGIKAFISCCANPKDLNRSLEISKNHEDIFLTLSFHPIYVAEFPKNKIEEYLKKIIELAEKEEKIVGIGETGLDYFWVKDEKMRELQKKIFIKHLEIAENLNLPVVIHSREAHEDVINILEEYKPKKLLWHFFGVKNYIDRLVSEKWFASFNTLIFRSKTHKKIVKKIPLQNLLLETDSPWLGFGKRNDPSSIIKVAEKVAEINSETFEKIWKAAGKNAKNLFSLKIDI